MPDYTLLNLKDVDDMAPRFGFAPDLEARFATRPLGLQRSGVSYQRLAPGFRMPFGHTHVEQEEVYVVISGGMRAKLDDEIVEVGTLDALRVPPEVARSFEAGPDGVEFFAFGAPNTGKAEPDAQQLPGWWQD